MKSVNKDLDLGFDIIDGITALDLERDRLASQGFDEDLHPFSSEVLSNRAREKSRKITQRESKDSMKFPQVLSKCSVINIHEDWLHFLPNYPSKLCDSISGKSENIYIFSKIQNFIKIIIKNNNINKNALSHKKNSFHFC